MRKVRDYEAELKSLEQRTRALKERRLKQLGELVCATGADALDAELLAGGLLAMVEENGSAAKEGWRAKGAAFFRARTRQARPRTAGDGGGASPGDDRAASA